MEQRSRLYTNIIEVYTFLHTQKLSDDPLLHIGRVLELQLPMQWPDHHNWAHLVSTQ